MKRVFLLMMLAVFMPLTSANAQTVSSASYPGLVIGIKPSKPQPPIKPLTLVQSDIEAYYSNEALTLIFNKDLGDADAVVSNLTTGDMWSASVSGVCSTTILLSGDEGYYQIAIYSDNEDYAGEFLL